MSGKTTSADASRALSSIADCPDANALGRLVDGAIDDRERRELEGHLDRCDACAQLITELALGAPRSVELDATRPTSRLRGTASALEAGATVSRFTLLEPLGAGGMGVVWAAYDPHLDRKIALKFVRADLAQPEMLARLEREAKAVARVTHPNVVAIHDIGADDDRIYFAQEFVRGCDLGAWLAARPRTVGEILEIFVQAARGLAAAHAAGIVHRDFKPSNVLVGDDGRARVVDFGVARSVEQLEPNATPSPTTDPRLTATGAAVGTPLYMSPEQYLAEPSDARSDQFSFCVSLAEALYGEVPFIGKTVADYASAVMLGKVRPPPSGSKVPAWLRAAIVRGLSRERADRFPTMQALIDVLEHDDARGAKRRRRIVVGAIAAIAAGSFAFALARRDGGSPCDDASAKLAAVWNPTVAAELQRAFTATGLPGAAQAAGRARAALDRYGQQWAAMHTDTCEATRMHGEQSEDLMDLRMTCLAQRLQEVKAIADVLVHPSASVVLDVDRIAGGESSLAVCADAAALQAVVRPPAAPETRAKVDELRARLARIKAAVLAGKYKDTLAEAEATADAARATGYAPVTAVALRELGGLQASLSKYDLATANLRAGYLAALGANDRVEAAEAAAALIEHVGVNLQKRDEGEWWTKVAHAELEGVGEAGHDTAGTIDYQQAWLLLHASRFDDAIAAADRAVEIWTSTRGADHVSLFRLQEFRAIGIRGKGKIADALTAFGTLLARAEKALGPIHPVVADLHTEIGSSYYYLQDLDAALVEYRQALAISKLIDPDGAGVGGLHQNIGNALADLHQLPQAVVEYQAALAIYEKLRGPESPSAGDIHNDLGTVLQNQGRYAEALVEYRRALAIYEKAVGPDAREAGRIRANVAGALHALGQNDEALVELRRAQEILTKLLGPSNPSVADLSVTIADILHAQHQLPAALAELQPALAAFEQAIGQDAPFTSRIRITIAVIQLERNHEVTSALVELARGLDALDKSGAHVLLAAERLEAAKALLAHDRPRALALAGQARDYYAAQPDPTSKQNAAALAGWIAAHAH